MKRSLSIRWKLQLVIMATTGLALTLTCGAFIAYQLSIFQSREKRSLQTLARVIADASSAALAFPNEADATRGLALLSAETSVRVAALYNENGQLFAQYLAVGADRAVPTKAGVDRLSREPGRLVLVRPVQSGTQRYGTLFIRWDLGPMYAALRLYVLIALLVLVGGLVAAFFVGKQLQRTISQPLLSLAETARRVAEQNEYTVRSRKVSNDEVGMLTDAFNRMLDEIQQREAALRQAHAELETRVEQRTAQLAEANRELEAFGYTVSHDLRAPLRHISSYVRLLEKDAGASLNERARADLEVVLKAATRMGHLIEDLLSLSRLGRATMVEKEVDLHQLVKEACQELSGATGERPIQWQIGELPIVQGDPTLLRAVIVNLLSNALKYTRPRNPARIAIGTQYTDAEVVCFVRDNGVGFDMAFVGKLFGVFQRLHSAEQFEGTGIGLASVRRAIQRHGGRTWAEGAPERGATFYFSLPRSRLVKMFVPQKEAA